MSLSCMHYSPFFRHLEPPPPSDNSDGWSIAYVLNAHLLVRDAQNLPLNFFADMDSAEVPSPILTELNCHMLDQREQFSLRQVAVPESTKNAWQGNDWTVISDYAHILLFQSWDSRRMRYAAENIHWPDLSIRNIMSIDLFTTNFSICHNSERFAFHAPLNPRKQFRSLMCQPSIRLFVRSEQSLSTLRHSSSHCATYCTRPRFWFASINCQQQICSCGITFLSFFFWFTTPQNTWWDVAREKQDF